MRLFDLVRQHREVQVAKIWALLQQLDLWDLRSFGKQTRRQRCWNAATRLLPCLHWLAKYKPRKQLGPDIAAGIAVSFLIVPQARAPAHSLPMPVSPACHARTPPPLLTPRGAAQGLSYAGVAGLPAIHGLCARPALWALGASAAG